MKIFLLEDDLILNEIIEEYLTSLDYDVHVAYDGNEAEEILYNKTFDLLLLDVNVPGTNGFNLLNELREKNIQTPAIFITSLNSVFDVEEGFKVGCHDYIKKPFELKELDIRINNIKKIFKIETNKSIYSINDITIDRDNLLIVKNKIKAHITLKELEVLEYLLKFKNSPVSIENISLNLWSYDDAPLPSTIRTYIKNIRKILGEEYITNIRGVGYKFNS